MADYQKQLDQIKAHQQAEEAVKRAQEAAAAAAKQKTSNLGLQVGGQPKANNGQGGAGTLIPAAYTNQAAIGKHSFPQTGDQDEGNVILTGLAVLIGTLGLAVGFKRGKHAKA